MLVYRRRDADDAPDAADPSPPFALLQEVQEANKQLSLGINAEMSTSVSRMPTRTLAMARCPACVPCLCLAVVMCALRLLALSSLSYRHLCWSRKHRWPPLCKT